MSSNTVKLPDTVKTPEVVAPSLPAAPQVVSKVANPDAVFVPQGADLTLAPAMPMARPRAFYVTSFWHITPTEGVDMIEAVNNHTNDKFSGTIADFNSMMRGN
jgi:hypothetical protein